MRRRFIPMCAENTFASVRLLRQFAVHPRVCGEHRPMVRMPSSRIGSSPRVRRTRTSRRRAGPACRFIPACAENTARRREPNRRKTVHPRVCGEHKNSVERPGTAIGSSPRVRRTQPWVRHDWTPKRFIPACAENTSRNRAASSGKPVHPRVCGEHKFSHAGDLPQVGSSTHRAAFPSPIPAIVLAPHQPQPDRLAQATASDPNSLCPPASDSGRTLR